MPEPTRQRWQPLRAGLVDLFYYDTEEFHFHHGSLLLRGNNGTGKSKVLALTVPFLLDGELAPHRVEPDGDRNKRMEWNLLLGGKYPNPERLGYTWLEFGRKEPGGTCHYLTLGCGLKAAAGRGMIRHWFFVTTQRIGESLSLVSPTGTPLTRERLREALADHGMIHDRASDYRRAVDEALFGLGPRYDALVSLLIQLRQPQLSKRPDERLLSGALTQALPPLDENLIAQAAEAFRGLDDEREALIGLRDTKKAADDFLTIYRRYARIAARRTAAGPRRAQAGYEQFGRDLGEAERAFAKADLDLKAAQDRLEELEATARNLTEQRAALAESPEARAADNLAREARRASELTEFAERQQDAHAHASRERARAEVRLQQARTALEAQNAAVAAGRSRATTAAMPARLAARHAAEVDTDPSAVPVDSGRGEELVTWRERSLRSLAALLDASEAAAARLRGARQQLDDATSALTAADERVEAAQRAVAAAGAELVAQTRRYLAGTRELVVEDAETVLAALELWVETLDGENPATGAVTAAYRPAAAALARAQAGIEAEQRSLRAHRVELTAEIERLRAGGHHAPFVPHTRAPGTRDQRPGAPLWRVVDFRDEVPPPDRAGLEAALEASGILDAWVCPDGTVLASDTFDVLLNPAGSGPERPAASLSGSLRVAIDPADPRANQLAEETVRRVLDAIGVLPSDSASAGGGAGQHPWVSPDGRFRIGPLTGRWHKDTAEYLGEGAREAARRARIADLRSEITAVDGRLVELESQATELADRSTQLDAEHDQCPSDTPLREAHTAVRGELASRERQAQIAAQAEELAAEAERSATAARDAAAEFASDVDLPTERAELREIGQALGEYRIALVKLWSAVAALATVATRVREAEPDLDEAATVEAEAAERHADAEREAASARARYQALAETVGTAVAELQRRLAETDRLLEECRRDTKQTRNLENVAREDRGRADGQRSTLADEVQRAAGHRDQAVGALRAFAATGLLALACPDLEVPDPDQPWVATPAVQLARNIDRILDSVEDSDRRWDLAQQSVTNGFKQLADGLARHGHQAAMIARDAVILVEVLFQGRTQPVAGLAEALDVEVTERQRVLSAREREVLETHLVNEVAGTLQELISSAERQVADMNQELQDRPTSTGMRLRLVWRASKNAPEGLADLRGRLLRQSSDVWNDADRQRVGAFLSQQITAERLRDDAGTWHEQLTRALDYRAWHEFVIQRYADGQWRPAAGPASGGERVLAASIPLFAAASSYYGSAGNPHAPRMIALDEAFAGVDDDSRAKCLGLLARFDLDVVMTSEREWGCYPEVPGLAIAQLARREGIDAVLVTPWRWDGSGSRYLVPRPRPEHQTSPDDLPDGLFA
jgi:uncharacterized protein (TIGR02680 family)